MEFYLFFFVYLIGVFFLNPAESKKLGFYERFKCNFYECCSEPYLNFNATKLEEKLNNYLYGQPLVKNTIINSLTGHFGLKNPQKALVLSFHGSTGVGKNFVSQLVADSLYMRGIRSKYFKQFISTKDFPHNDKIGEYKEKIKKTIEETVKDCPQSVFVFDEIDKIPIGLMDTIKPYIDFNHEIDGIDYRPSVFIFLSNSASKEITQLTLENDAKMIHRNKFELKPYQEKIQKKIYYDKEKDNKGLWHASIVDSFLIDFYVPFLPLERIHVKKCIQTELRKYNLINYIDQSTLESDLDYVADEMVYEPQGLHKFSTSGCKRVPNLVRNLIAEKGYQIRDEL